MKNFFKKKIIVKKGIDFFLIYYKLKYFYAKIKCLFYLNIINKIQKKKFLNLIINNKKKKIKNKILNKTFCFNKEIIFNLFLLDEIEKINILIIFIRKILINLSELEYKTIFYKNEIKKFTTLGYLYLYWNNLLNIDHELLFNFKFKNSILSNNIFNFIKNGKNKILNIMKNLLKFKKIDENTLNENQNNNLSLVFFLISINNHLNIFFDSINSLFLNYKNAIYLNYTFNFNFFLNSFKNNYFKIVKNLENLISINNNKNIENIFLESIYFIKINLNYFRKIISLIKINKKKIYLINFKKEKIFKNIKKYLIFKKINFSDCNIIIKKIYDYIKTKNISIYNITLYELNKINKIFKKDFFYKISFEYKFKKNNFLGSDNYQQILKSIQRAKYLFNKFLIRFKI
ncbi:hypothetical protein [Candidatus Carsonella ruddii]|uniref:Putative argininosuccinate lyase n=1 Tax=Candidatus Carsonella ruddii PC isolate NHV TaxID=1202540 RepID=J3YR02_CARRU|nr:hypothetical protein [Candidatus Carsonella ruddii]AFP84403.1 putative argininosuccinate lyase [Candidatus Carsonella ruddii PC isolate NHV]